MESFFANMKREELYRAKYRSEKEFRKAVKEYIRFYNDERPHSKNKYKTPTQKETEYFSKQAENKWCLFGLRGFAFIYFALLDFAFKRFWFLCPNK